MTFPEFSPYIFKIGSIGPTWYGLMYVISFILGYQFAKYRIKKITSWTEEQISDLLTYAIVGVILGGRIGYVLFYQFSRFIDNPLYLFKITEGGMSFHGGLLGVVLAMFLFKLKTKKSLLDIADFVAPIFPIGLFFGRIGNLINMELWGRVTDVPWGVIFPNAGDLPRHPSQLYEAGLEGLALFIILNMYAKTKPAVGRLSGLFLVGYSLARFFVEFFREPDYDKGFIAFDWLTMGQLLSAPMVLVGLFLLFRPIKSNSNIK